MSTVDPFSIASAFLMHTGSRHLQLDLTTAQRKVLAHPFAKLCILMAMFYISTRSLVWSVVLIAVYLVTIHILLNEKHPFNVFSRKWLRENGFLEKQEEISPIELYRQNLEKLT